VAKLYHMPPVTPLEPSTNDILDERFTRHVRSQPQKKKNVNKHETVKTK